MTVINDVSPRTLELVAEAETAMAELRRARAAGRGVRVALVRAERAVEAARAALAAEAGMVERIAVRPFGVADEIMRVVVP